MKIDINAFLNSLPIMGVGLLGIFIVTIVIIAGIYILKAFSSKTAGDDEEEVVAENAAEAEGASEKKESAMDLLKEREKKDFLEEEDNIYISHDL